MPTGKIKFFDEVKGYGFVVDDETKESIFLHSSVLPKGVTQLERGARVEYSIVDSKRGIQVLTLNVLEPIKSIVKAKRKSPNTMIPILEDLIKLLDGASETYRKNRHPDDQYLHKLATLLRAVANDMDV
ncbi:MAG: cold shock domain-containing protein [Bifidobacteriaceae bacterium]|jgi:CspA family cold shock protein|nr:cold shock domain-containing protein [Bifidobacteriaceae bacterium]